MQRLEGLLGKEEIVDFARARAQGRSKEAQFLDEAEETGLHYAIGGPTGSGRHTAVRALAAVFREAGLLERDEVLFVGVGDLEAGYVGQTRLRTQDAIERAAGGTLCVEYPSSLLAEKGERSYGPEALDALCAGLAAHSGDTCFAFLDSAEGLEAVFRAAPALRGAMSRIFTLEDLSPAQMEAIFREKTRDGMTFAPEVEALLPDFFLNWVGSRGGTGEGGGWAGGLALDRLIEDLRAAWQRGGGETVEEERGEEGARYRLRLRRIERAHFPGALQRYLTPSRAVAKDALQALEALPGLAGVKRSLRAIRRRVRYAGGARPGCYLYLGNPGVGKTTVARLMGGLLCAAGALAQGHVVERTARALCDDLDEFDQLVKLSRGGILFIDEAHQLAEPGTYRGREAIKRLLTVLEDAAVTSSTAIILAGYPAPMLRLLEQDEGLRSRFGSRESMVLFADYSAAELVQVMDYMASRAKDVPEIGARQALTLTEGFRARSLAVFRAVLARGDRNFGNARFVRTYLHDALSAQLERLERDYGELDDPPLDEIDVLTEADVPAPWRESAVRRRAAVDVSRLRTQRGEAVEEAGYDAACAALSPSVVLLEVYRGGQRSGTATGVLVSEDGLVLTCAHVVRAAERIRARVSCPGAPGGDTRWLEGEILEPVCGDCDLALLQLPGENYAPAPLRPAGEAVRPHERTLLLGYPLGDTLSAGNAEDLRLSDFAGRVASVQRVGAVERCYIDSTGLHGNSGSPVFSREDRRVIGIFSGSLVPGGERSLDELNYFYPLSYFWERFIQASD